VGAAAPAHVVRVHGEVPAAAADAERAEIAVVGHHHSDERMALGPSKVGDPRPIGERNIARTARRAPEAAATAATDAKRHIYQRDEATYE
jgi:hypothetical protein